MRRNAGFTLIELATTMSVVAILAGIAAPSFAGFIERQRASAAITSLMTHMSLARIAALDEDPVATQAQVARFHGWRDAWRRRGVLACVDALMARARQALAAARGEV